MPRRSEVDQILEWNTRRGKSRQGYELLIQIQHLAQEWASELDREPFTADFFPMRAATIIEVFVRESVREIVDLGQPYVDRARDLTKSQKIDYLFAEHLYGRKLSLGDIVAHSVSTNNITQIISVFEALIPEFSKLLLEAEDRWAQEIEYQPIRHFLEDFPECLRVLSKLFEVRHIVTHEMPRKPVYETAEIADFLRVATAFMEAADWAVISATKGRVPMSQLEINSDAGELLVIETATLSAMIARVKEAPDLNAELFEAAQKLWTEFADAEASLHANLVEGGSMYSGVWATAKTDLVRQRTEQLKWWTEREEGDV